MYIIYIYIYVQYIFVNKYIYMQIYYHNVLINKYIYIYSQIIYMYRGRFTIVHSLKNTYRSWAEASKM